MMTTRPRTRAPAGRPPLLSAATLLPLRWWSARQWRVAGAGFVLAFLVIGEVGETLPPTDTGRVYPVQWWNWVTLIVTAALIGLIAATFIQPGGRRALAGAGSGSAGTVAAIVMACPVCSPLAIPLLGTGGLIAFLVPGRGWIALASILLLAATLLLRLRAAGTCAVNPTALPTALPGTQPATQPDPRR